MKNKILIIITFIFVLGFQACDLVIDKDTTDGLSYVSTKPVVTVLGEPIISLPVGGTYVDAGVEAYAGDSVLDAHIVEGEVNSNQKGFYVVTYQAVNGFGWKSYGYRAVLVYDGNPYGSDIAGNYKRNELVETVIRKNNIYGYWEIDNIITEEGVTVPVVFADKGDDTYGIVPGFDPIKGYYSGTGVKTAQGISFQIQIITLGGTVLNQDHEWIKY